ncbi:hypothetical protein FALBO_1367 [Fusarium albosuccineum]|uniref:Uncharacterized protein n=1 Tax=Fusarium albosuccineum TaxID=1237068 RepID=A0A8H4LP62_9HYPO|nr:hypothetical protein FALBO_1367 [Fusarium albosuccineum]
MTKRVWKIIEVWRGSIKTRDGALQLLLLISYIFDWARDVYYENIMRHLRVLASGENDAATILYADTDVFSTRQYVERGPFILDADEDLDLSRSYEQQYVKEPRSNDILLRHASYVESRFCCLFITPDNFQTLLDSISGTTSGELSPIVDSLLTSLWIDVDTVSAMELQWTGNTRLQAAAYTPGTKFRTVISCTTYLATDWRIVRELYAVVVNENAWARMLQLMGSSSPEEPPPKEPGQISKDALVLIMKRLRAGSPAGVLLDAIQRRCLKIHNYERSFVDDYDDGDLRQGIHEMYKSFKKKASSNPRNIF